MKNISIEKRLKNSETCPDQLSPTLPGAQDRLSIKGRDAKVGGPTLTILGAPSTKSQMRRNISTKAAKDTLGERDNARSN